MPSETPFDLKFTSREVTAWGGLALLKRMLDGMGFKEAVQSWDLPPPRTNRGYRPEQLTEHRKLAHCRAQVDASGCSSRSLPRGGSRSTATGLRPHRRLARDQWFGKS
jgi:hypothetical protein